jgi:parvulin-like peptidyl-prolyl isomerase
MRRSFVTLTVAALVALAATVVSGCTSSLGYAAIVNGAVISANSINQQLHDIVANKDYVTLIKAQGGTVNGSGGAGSYSQSFVAIVLGEAVNVEIIQQRLAAAHALPSAGQLTTAQGEVQQEFESQQYPQGIFQYFPARYQKLLVHDQAAFDAYTNVATTGTSQAALTQYYQSHLSDYTTEACVSVIVIADKNPQGQPDSAASLSDAAMIKAQLDGGASFAQLAAKDSQDQSASNGGQLSGSASDGCLTSQDLGQLPSALQAAVVSLPLNQASDPVPISTGYVLVEVTKRTVEPLDSSVTQNIKEQMAESHLNQLVKQAHVKVNPEFGSFNPRLDQNGQVIGVVAPAVPSVGTTTTIPSGP